jgi:hypothetical protein
MKNVQGRCSADACAREGKFYVGRGAMLENKAGVIANTYIPNSTSKVEALCTFFVQDRASVAFSMVE